MESKNQNTAIISGSIDLEAIDKDKLVKGKNGKTYLPITLIVQEQSKYGNNVWITLTRSKEDRDNKVKTISLGNAAVKWIGDNGINLAERNEVTNREQNEDRSLIEPPY
tara:strand:+ start:103 stop:429 length:327 start_codon:yes stop_codon:yes gene_type:complete